MKLARFKKHLKNFQGNATLYALSESFYGWEHVVVSSISLQELQETIIFGANDRGVVLDWSALPGSIMSPATHREVLEQVGYEVVGEFEIN